MPLDEDAVPVALKGSGRQVDWAGNIRRDASWWIANKAMVTTMKFKEPSPAQMAGCSVGRSTSAEPAAGDGELPEEEERTRSTPAAPVMIPPRTEAAQKLHDLQDFEDRVSDAEKWAESVSHTPKLAEAAILAVLSRLYKDPMKTRLRGLAERKMAQAEAAIEKDKDAIRRMLQ